MSFFNVINILSLLPHYNTIINSTFLLFNVNFLITDELDLENGNGTQLLPHYAYRFWLKVTTKYMNTGGLPQRLFALDQIAPLDRRAQSTEPSPKILNVTGAGNYNVNGK